MLNDIEFITDYVFKKALDKNQTLPAPAAVYEVSKNLHEMINKINLVANHYLALDFTEEFLQNSSFGTPKDKWRYFLNEDMQCLNNSIRKYIFSLNSLSHENSFGSYLNELYKSKTLYGFVRDKYNIGLVQKDNYLSQKILKAKKQPFGVLDIYEEKTIDLNNFEQREELQNNLNRKNEIFKEKLTEIRKYICEKYILEDIVYMNKIWSDDE